MRKVTVIGGAGFIGTHLCARLANADIPFEIIDLKRSRSFPEHSKIADIRSLSALRIAMTGDAIIHLAAVHRDDVRDPTQYAKTNIDGTKNVCTVAHELGVSKIVFTSSVAVYGFAPPATDESGEIKPFHEYGRTKFEAEKVLRAWQAHSDSRALIIVRPTVVFGEGNRGNVYNLLRQIATRKFIMIGSGTNKKSMAYVKNIAAFLEHAIKSKCRYGVFNYVDEPDYDMITLVREVQGILNPGEMRSRISIPYKLGLVIGYIADSLSRILGRPLPISALRVRKFCATTSYKSSKEDLDNFRSPFSLREGLYETLVSEFVRPDPKRQIFFTE